jgi:hypothetical protein
MKARDAQQWVEIDRGRGRPVPKPRNLSDIVPAGQQPSLLPDPGQL